VDAAGRLLSIDLTSIGLDLEELGDSRNARPNDCTTLTLDDDEYIGTVTIAYTNAQVHFFSVDTTTGRGVVWGSASGVTVDKTWNFGDQYRLAGLVGTE